MHQGLRPRSFIASMGAPRVARHAGATPNTSAARRPAAAVKAEHAQIQRQLQRHGVRGELRDEEPAAPMSHGHGGHGAHDSQ